MNNNEYAHFGVTAFVNDDTFIKHYTAPTAETTQFWEEWLAANPHKQAEWQEARQLLEAVILGLNDYARTYLSEESQNLLLARIQASNAALAQEKPVVSIWRNRWLVAVAASFLLIFSFWYFKANQAPTSVYEQQVTALSQKVKEVRNASKNPKIVKLPDGSVITLSAQSRLSYPADFGEDIRTVFLSGEAEFEITKDLKKPFYVYANEIVTKVLGTHFVVHAFDEAEQVTVTVQSGQVSVYQSDKQEKTPAALKKEQGVLLLPNQQIVFDRATEQFKKTLVSNPIKLPSTTTDVISFEFNETPVVEAFERLKKAYGINLVYDAEALKDCQITTSLAEESLFQKLDIITQIIGGTYDTVDGQILITAKGCY